MADVKYLAVVLLICVVSIAEAVTVEVGAHVGAHDELGAIGKLVECALDLRVRDQVRMGDLKELAG